MEKLIIRLVFTFLVVTMGLLATALSCGGSGEPECMGEQCLELVVSGRGTISSVKVKDYVKVVDKTNVVVNVQGLFSTRSPLSHADDDKRSFGHVLAAGTPHRIVDIFYPKSIASMIFVSRADVTKEDIALDETKENCGNGSESADNTFAKRAVGGHCRLFGKDETFLRVGSYLGTVFDNPDATKARGTMLCLSSVGGFYSGSLAEFITDKTDMTSTKDGSCYLGIVNSAPNNSSGLDQQVKIDDAWINDPKSITEIELYAVGIRVDDKFISEFLPDSENFNLAQYKKAIDNPTFQKLLENNDWKDLKFKVKMVTPSIFASLE